MVKRTRVEAEDDVPPPAETEHYFLKEKEVEFFSSGCTLLDCVLGGGWAEKRIINIVGDKSSGKTLLAIEAMANFAMKYGDKSHIKYVEAESAFDTPYAESMGMPVDRVDIVSDIFTVEDMFENLEQVVDKAKSKDRILYIVDSLDALSDRKEQGRDIDKGSFGAEKAKKLSEMFRRVVKKLSNSNVTVMFISQIRDNIGVTFGESKTRSGGHALDFYCSQILWLAEAGKIIKESQKQKRTIGIDVRAKCKKNKVSLPFRECQFPLIFGYGVDDFTANSDFLFEVVGYESYGFAKESASRKITSLRNSGGEEFQTLSKRFSEDVKKEWIRIERKFLPTRAKYTR